MAHDEKQKLQISIDQKTKQISLLRIVLGSIRKFQKKKNAQHEEKELKALEKEMS